MSGRQPGEKLMQYVWQHRLWLPGDMRTRDGQALEVIDPGLLNNDAGPDFFNAKIRIGTEIWAGNIEIHVLASDWHRHGHDADPAYSNVVLHVVDTDDCTIMRADGTTILQVVMTCARDFHQSYRRMVDNPTAGLACADEIRSLPSIYLTDWITALGFERLYAKADRVEELVGRLDNNWREAVYVTLARALGFHTNSDAFERLAIATPLPRMLHHHDNIEAIEGLLFGQAGLIPESTGTSAEDIYAARLATEHRFLTTKYGLQQPCSLGWKMARMRPHNFPHRRIALLAAMVAGGFEIGRNIFNVRSLEDAYSLFRVRLSDFWQTHYTFEPSAGRPSAALSKNSADILIINVVAPILYAYGRQYANIAMQESAVDILHALPPEQNNVTRLFGQGGIDCDSAFTGQALLQLRRNYCEPRKCLYCRLGHRFLSQKALRR